MNNHPVVDKAYKLANTPSIDGWPHRSSPSLQPHRSTLHVNRRMAPSLQGPIAPAPSLQPHRSRPHRSSGPIAPVVGQGAMLKAAVPMAILISGGILLCLVEWFGSRKETEAISQQTNPTELKSALVFGALYAIILFAVAATKVHFEKTGLFVVAALSGLTDMDAITLSTSRMVSAGRLTADTGWKVIVSAVMANLIFKAALVAMLGHRKLFVRVAILFGILVIVGGVLIAAFP
jgi:uncharacterized membrane protein (DUF4010 family)